MYTYGFERLEVWREAKDLTLSIYRLCTELPRSEEFGLSSQLKRASVSICSNLAESTTYKSKKHQSHYSTLAFGSAVEVLNHLILASELGLIDKVTYLSLRSNLESITNKINSLRNYQWGKMSNDKLRMNKNQINK